MYEMKELNKCPFCNGRAEVIKTLGFKHELLRAFVKCNNCGASSGTFSTIEGAIEAWNMRKPIDEMKDKFKILFQHHNATKIVQRLVFEIVDGER